MTTITANQEGAEAATRKIDSTPISNTRVTLPIYSEHLTSETLQAPFFFELGATAYRRGGRPIRYSAEREKPSPMSSTR